MQNNTITDEQFMEALRAVASENPDFSYPEEQWQEEGEYGLNSVDDDWHYSAECVYTHPDGTPACIIGHVVNKLDPELLQDIAYPYLANARSVLPDLFPGLSTTAVAAGAAAQGAQDGGHKWSYALEQAEERYALYGQEVGSANS